MAGGARVILGGKRPSADSAFFEPTILNESREGDTCVRRRTLRTGGGRDDSPRRRDRDRSRHDTKYGLGGSVCTRDLERERRVADKIDAGMVYVNHPAWIYEDMPFGGIKKSGYGRETGPLGIQEFVNKKLFREPEIVEKNF